MRMRLHPSPDEPEGLVGATLDGAKSITKTGMGMVGTTVGMSVLGATAVVGGVIGGLNKGVTAVGGAVGGVLGADINSEGETTKGLKPASKSSYDVDRIREVCGEEALAQLLAHDEAAEENATKVVDPRKVAETEWRRVQWGSHTDADWMLLYKPIAAMHVYFIGAAWLGLFLFDMVLTLVLN